MKKILLLIIPLLFLTGCNNKDGIRFKEDYESLNGQTSASGKEYRTITLPEDNPFVYATLEDINILIEHKETFIVYFGANWCPWCRSLLNTAIDEAKANGIKKIYYVNVREGTDEKNDIRDIYSLDENNEVYLSHEGTEAYHKFLEYANNVLKDYKSHGVEVENTKRVGAPNFILFKDGKAISLTTGISENETDPYMELTDEIKKDMKNIFDEFYKQYK